MSEGVIMGVRAAAAALGLSHSTISRYLQAHPEINCGTDKRPKVDLAKLREHRASTVNMLCGKSHAGRLMDERSPVEAARDGEATTAPDGGTDILSYARARAQREAAMAERALLELDEKRKLLVPREEVRDAIWDAGQHLQANLLTLSSSIAERLAAMEDPREIAALLDAEHRKVLEALANGLRLEEKTHPAG